MSRRNTMLLAAVAAVALVAAYWMLALAPKREQAAKLVDVDHDQAGRAGGGPGRARDLRAGEGGYKANYTLVARLGKAVPADDDVRSLLVQLNSAAGRSKVDFRTITVGGRGAAPAAAATGKGAAAIAAPPPARRPSAPPASRRCRSRSPSRARIFSLGDFFQRLDRFVAVKQQRMDVTGRLMVLDKISLLPDADGLPEHARPDRARPRYLLPPTQGLTAGASAGPAPGRHGHRARDARRRAPPPPPPTRPPPLEPPDDRHQRHLALPRASASSGRWRSSWSPRPSPCRCCSPRIPAAPAAPAAAAVKSDALDPGDRADRRARERRRPRRAPARPRLAEGPLQAQRDPTPTPTPTARRRRPTAASAPSGGAGHDRLPAATTAPAVTTPGRCRSRHRSRRSTSCTS